ncbi:MULTISPECIES: 23S rRNA accumulation protein YceD [Psychromonas]|uniref:23S rRNA accumulation protein YceD n=1 Tax=Psychromonas TaxID=67572 RepID=UPI00036E4EA9|nr:MULTISPECIES: 23S rRNA accumulation protein YceD [Psychromonas]
MQKVKLPISVDPVRAAQKHLELEARIPKELLSRLAESTISVHSDIDTVFSFDIDKQKLRIFHGKASVAVELICQRCNAPMIYQCEAEFTYCPVHNQEQENNLPDAYESIYYDENGEVNLHQVVEDELILALPQIAKHAIEECQQSEFELTFGEIDEEEQRPNPFEALAKLKHK